MTSLQACIATLVRVALVAILIGLYTRGRHRQCRSFVAYALIILVCGGLPIVWPARFFNQEFWMIKQALYDSSRMVVAVELAWLVLRAFPGAMRTAQLVAAVFLPAAVVAILSISPAGAGYRSVAEWAPRMSLGAVFLFSLTAMLVLWYHLPVRPWHRALIMGFCAYLSINTVCFNVLRIYGWGARDWFNLAEGLGYLLLVCWWTFEAWRPEPSLAGIPTSVIRRLGYAEARA